MTARATWIHHLADCPYCDTEFDLLSAPWCMEWEVGPSKVCPHCGLPVASDSPPGRLERSGTGAVSR